MSTHLKFSFPSSSTEALDRVVEAYGFKLKLELAEHLGIAASSLSSRYKRDIFPADIVLQCSIETGANIHWLVSGEGEKFGKNAPIDKTIDRLKLIDGRLENIGKLTFDFSLLNNDALSHANLISVREKDVHYIVASNLDEVQDGNWLVEIEGKAGFRTLTLIPIRKVRVSGLGMAFDCAIDDIKIIGRVILTIA
ncbi:phage repressor protein CI [Pectobacterium aquaticum]|uniref:Phage repressor protein n=1 Tax=Pectobacterium aquaticum TaxID=2204145 RepID=A0A426JAE1_9GAMM|nr:phage repressor protein CI [Pectobacterium aquaticum]RRN97155.1 phage repressor protein [Pectobacterium aquaticum]RRO04486.1 phage repressor protein [Pectobacterium aquaticum]RRO10210.1 phage repressor protein [Pectobacterium aquaticum]